MPLPETRKSYPPPPSLKVFVGNRNPATRPIPALKALAALALIAAIALLLYAALPAGASSHFTDYDTDDDGLIEIDTIAELQGIRFDGDGDGFIPGSSDRANYDAAFPNRQTVASNLSTSTRMGCPARCIGYELTANLDFATATTSLRTWAERDYRAIFEGNGYTISNLSINVTTGINVGLIRELDNDGVVRNLGMINPSVTVFEASRIGVIAGRNQGTISASWVSGGSIAVTSADQDLESRAGGLVGRNDITGAIIASYSTASVNVGSRNDGAAGGLVGDNGGLITASYAAGSVTGTSTTSTNGLAFGGLVGEIWLRLNIQNQITSNSVITDSYCTVDGQAAACIGGDLPYVHPAVPTSTAAQLQTPTGYTGIYENWNVDIDGDTFPDNPWNFGATSAYPTIRPLAQRTADYDLDNDNLIDVDTLHKLNAIRHDRNGDGLPESAGDYVAYAGVFPGGNFDISGGPRMGCATFCIGYELSAGLDFAADGVAVTSTDAYPNWAPIGGVRAGYSGVFEGNGRAIARLTINRTSADAGLFGRVAPRGVLRNVGMVDADIRGGGGGRGYGTLAGVNDGTIAASYASGGTVALTGGNAQAGGLVGVNSGTILSSYSTAAVNGGGYADVNIGGLAGVLGSAASGPGAITASYAAGAVSGGSGADSRIGGLAGRSVRAADAVTRSYCDATVNGGIPCVGAAVNSGLDAVAQTTSELQTPVAYAGIYARWNRDVDGDAFPDYPWNFRAATQYPVLNTPAQRQTAAAVVTDYDQDNDNLIEIASLRQLDALRQDYDGDGRPQSAAAYPAYVGAFPNGNIANTSAPYMGCAAICIGYELAQSLDFDTSGDGRVTAADDYPDWQPIAAYAAALEGNGHTITRLTISGVSGNAGLFDTLTANAAVRNLGIIDAAIASGGGDAKAGILAADNGGRIAAAYAQSGAVTVTGASAAAGGLVGQNSGSIRAAWATASVTGGAGGGVTIGGLVGRHTGSITAAYAAGPVTGGAGAAAGGLVGAADGANAAITYGYCDTQTATQNNCIGAQTNNAAVTAEGQTAAELQAPTGYDGIYQRWNIDLNADEIRDDPWNFGTSAQYPTLKAPAQRQPSAIPQYQPPPAPAPTPEPTPTPTPDPTPAPAGDGGATGDGGPSSPVVTAVEELPPYDSDAAHPEIYVNAEYGMTATCETHDPDPETGNPQRATITFNLGSYTGPIILNLSIWHNQRYVAYETRGIALPALEREGQRVRVRVATDPAQTRFRLDGRRNGLAANLVLGYADCRSDGP